MSPKALGSLFGLFGLLLAGCSVRTPPSRPSPSARPATAEPARNPLPAPQPVPGPVARAEAVAPADRCTLPIADGRPCKAAMRRYHYDAQAARCREFIFGGCKPNANNFMSAGECLAACAQSDDVRTAGSGWRSGAHALGCQVDRTVFPSGASNVPRPHDCNTCTCRAGQLEACTEKACPESSGCPSGTRLGTSCAEAGTTGGCVVVETACLRSCTANEDCVSGANYGRFHCIDGSCRSAIGSEK